MKRHVLIICGLSAYKNRMDKLDYNFMVYLQNNSKYNVTLHETNTDQDNITQIVNNDPNSIIIVFSCCPEYVKQFTNTKIFYVYDYCCTCCRKCDGSPKNCGFRSQIEYIKNMGFNYVFYKYENYLSNSMFNDRSLLKFKFPHFMFDTNLYNNKQLPKEYDILFYGATYPEGYPFRNRLYYLLKKNTNKFNIKFLPYTKKHLENMITGEKLVLEINKSWLTIATKNIADLLLAKYYEIAMSGSVVCGNYPDLDDEQFLRKHMVYIDDDMTDDQIISIIENSLKDKKRLLEIPNITYEYFANKYTMAHGVTYFDKLIDKVYFDAHNK